MPIQSPTATTEKIMLFGQYGSGKTHDMAEIIKFLAQMGSDANFKVVDTDGERWIRTVEDDPTLLELWGNGRIRIWQPYTFGEMIDAAKEIVNSRPRKQDWVVVDRVSVCWDRAADWYCRTRLGKTQEELEAEYRESKNFSSKGETALLKYYGTGINPMYVNSFEDPLVYMTRCNVMFMANESKLNEPGGNTSAPKDSQQLVNQFKEVGFKPKCKSDTPSKFHTIIYKQQRYKGRWFATTARETGKRGQFDGEEISNFAVQYFLEKSGWVVY